MKHLTDPQPLINPWRAARDKRKFLQSGERARLERKLIHLPDEALPWNFKLFLMHRGFLDWWDADIARRVA